MPRRIGLTMRRVVTDPSQPSRGGCRDTLAPEWAPLLRSALAGARWRAIPNLGEGAVEWAERWGLDALILTGGNDLSTCPERDATEHALLSHCLERAYPVLGVCRGLQMVQTFFGGAVCPAGDLHGGGRPHEIRMCHARGRGLLHLERMVAASYHRFGVRREALASELDAFALAPDGLVEGLFHRSHAVTAVQWHPERPLPEPEAAVRLLRSVFG